MRRVLAFVLGVGSVPMGVGVGVWMAQLKQAPPCPVRGLGTIAICSPRPLFTLSMCVMSGGVVAALALLLSIVAFRPASRVAVFDLAAAAAGVLIGLRTSTFMNVSPRCAPNAFCIISAVQRFAVWQSALIGAAAMVVMVAIGAAVNPAWRRANLDAGRRVRSWLFKDLSQFAATGGAGSDAR